MPGQWVLHRWLAPDHQSDTVGYLRFGTGPALPPPMGDPATQESTVDALVDQHTLSAPDGPPSVGQPAGPQAGHAPVELRQHGWGRRGPGEYSGDQLEIANTVQYLEAVPVPHIEPVGLDEVALVRGGFAEPYPADRD